MSFEITSLENENKLNKAYLRKLDRKFDRLFKGTGRLTNTSKSVYSFEGEISEEEDEYNSDSSYEEEHVKKDIEGDPIYEYEKALLLPPMDELFE